MITGRQIREARKLLGWSVATLVAKAVIDDDAILRAERTNDEAQISAGNLAAIRTALEAADVIFVAENGDRPGVRLRKPQV